MTVVCFGSLWWPSRATLYATPIKAKPPPDMRRTPEQTPGAAFMQVRARMRATVGDPDNVRLILNGFGAVRLPDGVPGERLDAQASRRLSSDIRRIQR
jgi:hypothetical protein